MPKERSILVVDDEEMICWGIKQTLARPGEVRVETANSAEEAVEIMKHEQFDLVITDIRMREMNGFELLSNIRTLYPSTGVVVMTAYGSAAAKREASERGSLLYLDKTFEIDEIRQVVRKALEQVDRTRDLEEQQTEGFSGQIGNLNLVDMVQLHCLARNTVSLDVRTPSQRGLIGFADGEVVYAETDTGLEGREAFRDMLGWTGGQFETVNEPPGTQNVTESWESLLIDASDVIASTAQATSVSGQPSSQGVTTEERAEVNMHAVLEELAVEQGVLGAFVVGDSGVLVDHVITAYAGSPDDIAELGKGLKAISRIRDTVEEDSENRVILQFEKTRILAMEISDTAVYLIILTTGAGVLARLLEQLNSAVKRLATLF
jgi:CheY-like chemotaxis protein/predicted regulator of Ras-like GTPase activity (Roadblock/LC7/MglB family)